MYRQWVFIILVIALIALAGCAGDGDDDDAGDAGDDDDDFSTPVTDAACNLPVPVRLEDSVTCGQTSSPPVLDGTINPCEWMGANGYEGAFDLYQIDEENGYRDIDETIGATLYLANDSVNLYVGLRIEDPSLNDNIFPDGTIASADVLTFYFDEDSDGVYEADEDGKEVTPFWGSQYLDFTGPGQEESRLDRRYDGMCRIAQHVEETPAFYQVECRIPLASGDERDISLRAGDRVPFNIRYVEGLVPSSLSLTRLGLLRGSYQSGQVTDWIKLNTVSTDRGLPDDPPAMDGHLTFASYMDDRQMDLYFASAEGEGLVNLVVAPVHIMNPSLSRDGTKIAFHGATADDDYAGYEIYTVNVDGTGLRQLTDNNVLDGHPGWSPDGERIVFVRFTDESESQGGQVFIMNEDGTGEERITFTDFDENDPDFLTEDLLVFKSTRWTGKEQLAVMNTDGTGMRRLTENEYSDHDAIGSPDGEWIVFERYEGPGDWWDPYNMWQYDWNIFLLATDGNSQEVRLTDDEYISWLPVFSPDGKYVLYQKTLCPEYTPLFLIELETGDQWPVLPQWTKMGYIDWR